MNKEKGYGPGLHAIVEPGPMQSARKYYNEAHKYLGSESTRVPSDTMIAAWMITAALDYLAACTVMTANIKNGEKEDA